VIFYTNKTERYNWNIVESGVEHHNPTNIKFESSEVKLDGILCQWEKAII